ncbi:hypothetical protein LINPERPRIM_LOCUS25183 [Linum perenne]
MAQSFLSLGAQRQGASFATRLADVLEPSLSIWVGALLLGRSFKGFWWDSMWLGRLVSEKLLFK